MYATTEITVCPFSNKHSAAHMSPNIVINNAQSTCLTINNVHMRSHNMCVFLFVIVATPAALQPGRLNWTQQSKLGIETRSSLSNHVSDNMSNKHCYEITSAKSLFGEHFDN
ncbi:hypothetical protein TNCV_2471101 [Trichonephila clavipes]|nr:hypothetical protein TNCV_2471101 [Trichonephila clavipes]